MPEVRETDTPVKGLLAQTRNLSELCRHASAHEVQDEPCPKITVKEVWCVAVHDTVCNGHCDGTKHTTIEKSCEEFVLRSETSQNSTTSLEHRDGSNFTKVITNFETTNIFKI